MCSPVLILRTPEYRCIQTDRIVKALREGGVAVEVLEAPHVPSLDTVIRAVTAMNPRPAAMIRWDEHGNMFGRGKRWKDIETYLWRNGIAPLSVDYGLFDHYNGFLLDLHKADGASTIGDELPALSDDPIDWPAEADPRIAAYAARVQGIYAKAKELPPLVDGEYVAVFAQCSASLSRIPVKGNIGGWLSEVCGRFKARGMATAIKTGPIHGKGLEFPEGVPVFKSEGVNSDENMLANARLAVHARNVAIICSSVNNEFILAGLPVMACGRSWFNGLDVFAEARCWDDMLAVPVVNHSARNRYIRWWLKRQFYSDQAAQRLAERLAQFRAMTRADAAEESLDGLTAVMTVYAATDGQEKIVLESAAALAKQVRKSRKIAAVDLAPQSLIDSLVALGFEIVTVADGQPPRMSRLLGTAIQSTRTRYVLTVECDVRMNPGCVKALIADLDAAPPEVAAIEAVLVNEQGKAKYPSIHRLVKCSVNPTPAQPWNGGPLLADPMYPTFSATLWRREALDKVSWSALPLLMWADRELWKQIGAGRVSVIDRAATALHHGSAARLAKQEAIVTVPSIHPVNMRWAESSKFMRCAGQKLAEFKPYWELVNARKPKVYLEIGSNEGRSLALIQDALAPGAKIISVDTRAKSLHGVKLEDTFAALRARGFCVAFVFGDSTTDATRDRVREAIGGDGLADLVFIDGDHSAAAVQADHDLYCPLVRRGGLLAFHDVANSFWGVKALWTEIKRRCQTTHEFISGGSMGIGVQEL